MTGKNYKAANYAVEIAMAQSMDDVFNHVIDLSKWWPEEFEGEQIRLNTEFIFKTGDTHYSKNKVIEFVPNKKVVWVTTESVRKTDGYDWTGTKFIFELTSLGDNTLLKFTYDGVVFEHESDRLVRICNMTIKEIFYNFITNGNATQILKASDVITAYNDQTVTKGFTAGIEVEKSSGDVFKAITDDVSKWWGGPDLNGSSTKLSDEFVIHHPGAHYSKQKLIEVIPDEKVVWLVTESELNWLEVKTEWTGTRMIFELTPQGDKTMLHFMHEGLLPGRECYDRCAQGWDMVINSRLFNFITTGKAI